MKAKLEVYEKRMVQLPAIVAGYLNPRIPQPTDPTKLKELKTTICAVLQDCYSDKLHVAPPHNVLEQSNATLFEALFSSSEGRGTSNQAVDGVDTPLCDEVDRYLAMGVTVSQSFIDVVQWWIGRKDVLWAHYQMAMDYLATPAASTQQVNSMPGREFTSAQQSLSSDIFTKTMCLRSWMKLDILKIPCDRRKAMTGLGSTRPSDESIDEVVKMIEMDQDEWVEEVLDDGVVGMLNVQFDNMLADNSDYQDRVSERAY
jgi:hypothetical protein